MTANERLLKFCADVKRDLQEQRKLGVRVSAAAIKACDDVKEMEQYFNSASVEEIADLLKSLH